MKLIPHSEIRCWVFPWATTSEFVEKKLIGRLQSAVNRLVDFEDSQAATYLLRVSFSVVRAVHFMRTTPIHQWKKHAIKFDGMVRGAIEKILGFPFSDSSYAQACLTPKLGGLGLRDFAYQASWYECGKIAHETWDPPPGTPPIPLTQKQASFKFDEQMLAFLVNQAEPREAQRLRRCAQWIPNGGSV